jgi:elongation factor Ts
MISIDQIKKLREETEVSVGECKKALLEANGDFGKAKEILRKMGKELAEKKGSREANQGIIDCYVHPNKKIGVLLELNCETDFVAESPDFKNLAHEICLQVAGFPDETPLLDQSWIKDPSKTIKDLISECVAKLRENIVVKRSVKYEL